MPEAVIVDCVRTPSGRGKPGGALSGVHPTDLLAGVLEALVTRNDLDPAMVDDVIGGCVARPASRRQHHPQRAARRRLPRVRARHHHRPPVRLQPAGGHFAAQGVMTGAVRHRHRVRRRVDEPGAARLLRAAARTRTARGWPRATPKGS